MEQEEKKKIKEELTKIIEGIPKNSNAGEIEFFVENKEGISIDIKFSWGI